MPLVLTPTPAVGNRITVAGKVYEWNGRFWAVISTPAGTAQSPLWSQLA